MSSIAFKLLMGLVLRVSFQEEEPHLQRLVSSTLMLAQKAILPEELEEQLIKGMDQGIKGNYLEAIRIFSRLIQVHPHYADAYYNRGIAKTKLEDKQGAIADYNQAIKINADFAEAHQERGKLWLELGDKVQAIKDFQKAALLYKQQGNTISYNQVIEKIQSLQQP